ncbi:site-2 protease family protein [Chitinimonas sp. BJYL2]|uniref:site-2 protease family protein n=1 Tax=Chitinimonas sp. BJYL2 TaxID=2976696 RepID=UPI0022B56113|nr:site-2 protease family protein [Chitinimonas sp. BJYL2]
MEDWNIIQKIAIYAIPVLFAITVHEASHGYAAKHFGDRTAEMEGRLSLNPLRHIDLFGTIIVPALALLLGGFLFGWAKPVPVDFRNLRSPKRDMMWVAAAGPASNLAMAFFWGLMLNLAHGLDGNSFQMPMAYMAQAGIQINVVLMVLNLLPLPPLDGGRILVSLLPNRAAYTVSRIEPYGMFILIALIFTGVLTKIMLPFIALTYGLLGLIL